MDLKKDLKNTRVLGVGKNAIEKTKTLARNFLVSCARLVGVVGGTGAAVALTSATMGLGAPLAFTLPGILALTKLGGIREALKRDIKNIESSTIRPDSTPQPLKNKKTWKSGAKVR